MKVISRTTALAEGRTHYFTGKPCKKGHLTKRYVITRKCAGCTYAEDKRRYQRNKEHERTRSRTCQRQILPEPTRPCPERCELCSSLPGKRALHLDHDHKTGLFRGWLCQACNLNLGKFGDDVRGLQQAIMYLRRTTASGLLPTEAAERKQIPLASGVFDYFPAALVEIAKVSWHGNQQHNPGQELHWARGKSMDHADTMQRHFAERGTFDVDGRRHSAKMCWRALALLQMEMEAAGAPIARGAKVMKIEDEQREESKRSSGVQGLPVAKAEPEQLLLFPDDRCGS